jgi:hypothetical protein
MFRTGTLLLAGIALAASSVFVRGQDDESRALALKAVKAHGGKELLSKYKAAQVKIKGDVDVMGVQAKFSGEVFFLFPEKMKNVVTIEVNNMNIEVVQVFDGKQFFVKAGGNSIELKDAKIIEEAKEGMYAEKVASLFDLDEKGYKFAALGEAKVEGKDAVGIRVSREGKRDVNLYFDTKTHLLVKYEFRGRDFMGMMEVTQEKILSDYREVMGVQTPRKITVLHDGKKAMDLAITDVTYAETFDDSYFVKP